MEGQNKSFVNYKTVHQRADQKSNIHDRHRVFFSTFPQTDKYVKAICGSKRSLLTGFKQISDAQMQGACRGACVYSDK